VTARLHAEYPATPTGTLLPIAAIPEQEAPRPATSIDIEVGKRAEHSHDKGPRGTDPQGRRWNHRIRRKAQCSDEEGQGESKEKEGGITPYIGAFQQLPPFFPPGSNRLG